MKDGLLPGDSFWIRAFKDTSLFIEVLVDLAESLKNFQPEVDLEGSRKALSRLNRSAQLAASALRISFDLGAQVQPVSVLPLRLYSVRVAGLHR